MFNDSTCLVFMTYSKKKILNFSGIQCLTKSSEGLSVSIIKVEYYIVRERGRENWDSNYERIKGTCGTKNVLFLMAKAEGIFLTFITVSVKCCPPPTSFDCHMFSVSRPWCINILHIPAPSNNSDIPFQILNSGKWLRLGGGPTEMFYTG